MHVAACGRRAGRHRAARDRGGGLGDHGGDAVTRRRYQLLANSIATAFGLAVIILMVGPVSGAHLNPLVSLADWWLGRRNRSGLTASEVGVYAVAQVAGAIVGAVIANVMFDLSPVSWSQTARTSHTCGSARWSPRRG